MRDEVPNNSRFRMQTELRPCQNLEELIQRSEAARQRDPTIRKIRHQCLAFMHGLYDVQLQAASPGTESLRQVNAFARLPVEAVVANIAHDADDFPRFAPEYRAFNQLWDKVRCPLLFTSPRRAPRAVN